MFKPSRVAIRVAEMEEDDAAVCVVLPSPAA